MHDPIGNEVNQHGPTRQYHDLTLYTDGKESFLPSLNSCTALPVCNGVVSNKEPIKCVNPVTNTCIFLP